MNPLSQVSSGFQRRTPGELATENKSRAQNPDTSTQAVVNIAIEISDPGGDNPHLQDGDAQSRIMTGMTKLHTLAKAGNADAVDMLMQLSAHKNDAIAGQAQTKILLLNTAIEVSANIKSVVSELALALFKANNKKPDDFEKDRLFTGILYLAGAQANRIGDKSAQATIEEKLASRNPQKKIDPTLVDTILNPGRLVPNHEIYNSAKKIALIQHIEIPLNLNADDNNSQIQAIKHKLNEMQVSPSGHKVVEARIHGNNHYITALFSLDSGGNINCDCLDTHSDSIPEAQNQLTLKLNAALGPKVGTLTFTRNDNLQRNNACGIVNLMLLKHLGNELSTEFPVAALQPASPPESAKPTIKSMIDDFSTSLDRLDDAEKDTVFSAQRAEIIADWEPEPTISSID
jgi:hypothetical protein